MATLRKNGDRLTPESVVPVIESGNLDKALMLLYSIARADWKGKDPVTLSKAYLLLAEVHLMKGAVLNSRSLLKHVEHLGITDEAKFQELSERASQLDSTPGDRFRPDPAVIEHFQHQVLVVCRHCGHPGAIQEDIKRFVCSSCAYCVDFTYPLVIGKNATFWGMDLLLKVSTRHGVLWAYNAEHLAQLKALVGAKVRVDTRGYNTRQCCCYAAPWWKTLPKWIVSAKNRDEILKAITKMEALLPQ